MAADDVAVLAVDTDFHEKIPELLPFRPEMRENFVADPANRERLATFNDRPWKTILVVNIGKPGPDSWFDRLPRLAHEDYVQYA
jgi:3-hydroxypropanoate dehydrogenase